MSMSNVINTKGIDSVLVEKQMESDIELDGKNPLKHREERQ